MPPSPPYPASSCSGCSIRQTETRVSPSFLPGLLACLRCEPKAWLILPARPAPGQSLEWVAPRKGGPHIGGIQEAVSRQQTTCLLFPVLLTLCISWFKRTRERFGPATPFESFHASSFSPLCRGGGVSYLKWESYSKGRTGDPLLWGAWSIESEKSSW